MSLFAIRRAVGVLSFVMFSAQTHGATLRVPADFPSVLAGVDAASQGDTVLVSAGVWTEKATRPIAFDQTVTALAFIRVPIVLRGEGNSGETVLDAQGEGSAIARTFAAFGIATISDLTVTGCSGPGLISYYYPYATLPVSELGQAGVVSRVRFVENQGAAVYGYGAIPEIEDCVFSRNGLPAAINAQSTLYFRVRRCVFDDNRGSAITTSGMQGMTSIDECEFRRNGNGPGSTFGAVRSTLSEILVVRNCLFDNNTSQGEGGGAIGANVGAAVIEGNAFIGNRAIGTIPGGGIHAVLGTVNYSSSTIRNNTFWECEGPGELPGSAVYFLQDVWGDPVEFLNNVVAGSLGGAALARASAIQAEFASHCNVFWENAGGNTGLDWYSDNPDGTADLVADPEFCDPEGLDFTIRSSSPCAPPNSLGCGLIGAFGVACGAVSLEPTSWARIKAMYR